jgi:hypothetical protein
MSAEDAPAVVVWLVAIALMIWIGWRPWRETRNQLAVDIPGERPQTPVAVFVPPLIALVGPFFAQIVRHGGVNVWRHPHLLMPFGLIQLGALVVIQVMLRKQFLKAAETRRREIAERRKFFDASP